MKTVKKKQTIEEEYGITGSGGKSFEITVKGNIPLLALGYRGLMAWRAKRIEAEGKADKKKHS